MRTLSGLWLLGLVALLMLGACGKQEAGSSEAATPPPTTNPAGQPISTPNTPGAAAEERKAGGY
ncbi:MAG: hypothetical protein RMK45_00995 [Armatimonadota bacterium]|nr:hypothetical protein [Armatimonadota bacterium]